MNRVPLSAYFAIMVILGLVALLFAGPFRHWTGSSTIRNLLDLIAIFIAFMAGRRAKYQGRRVVNVGAMVGGLYGGLSGLSKFFITITRSEFLSKFNGKTPPTNLVSASLRIANSPVIHALEFLGSFFGGVILGLIIAALGSVTAKRHGDEMVI